MLDATIYPLSCDLQYACRIKEYFLILGSYLRYAIELTALGYFMKIMAQIFVDHDNLVKVINMLSELEITGFYLIEYRGMAPNAWKNFRLSEDPDMALNAIKDQSEPGIMINTVVGSNNYRRIIDGLEDALRGKRYTIIGHEINSIKVKGD